MIITGGNHEDGANRPLLTDLSASPVRYNPFDLLSYGSKL
jgi:hypothetical protein